MPTLWEVIENHKQLSEGVGLFFNNIEESVP